jgi:cell division protein FtsB
VSRVRATNGWKLALIAGAALVATAAGARHVYVAQQSLQLKRDVFVGLLTNRQLAQERDVLERQVAELTAAPRVALRARELLGMRPPKADELIVVPATPEAK